jgi:enterochelin esterase-like enzyme
MRRPPSGAREKLMKRVATFILITLFCLTLTSALLEEEKTIKVWLPPGYDDAENSYPLLLVNDGEAWLERGQLTNALEYRAAQGDPTPVVAFVPSSPQWWTEAGGSRTAEYARMQVEELLPALDKRYRLLKAAAERAVMGNRFYGFSAAYAALKYPQAFGAAAIQSVYFGLGAEDELESMIKARSNPDLRLYIDWNQFEERSVDTDFDNGKDSDRLSALFKSQGYRSEGGLMRDSYGWGGWRNRSARLLAVLFPSS